MRVSVHSVTVQRFAPTRTEPGVSPKPVPVISIEAPVVGSTDGITLVIVCADAADATSQSEREPLHTKRSRFMGSHRTARPRASLAFERA